MHLKNKLLQVEVSDHCGNLEKIDLIRGRKLYRWGDCASRLVISDELRGRTFTDTEDPRTIQSKRIRSGIRIVKRFKGADFIVRETWRMKADALDWTVEVVLKPRQPARSIELRQLLPYPCPAYGTGAWTARADFPTTVDRLAGLDLHYGELCYGTALPSLTLYRQDQDLGLTVTKPFGLKTSQLSFEFMGYREAGVDLKTSMRALRPGAPAVTQFLLHPHLGCWRPGLAWLYKRYPKYFNPPNQRVREIEGGYLLGHPFMTGDELDSMLPHALKWEELHCHFPWYGEYLPAEKEWFSIDTWEACVAWDQIGGAALAQSKDRLQNSSFKQDNPITRKLLTEHLRLVQQRGVQSLYYWQCAGDASPCIQQQFPDAIARNKLGEPYPGAADSVLMNADPATSFGKKMRRDINSLLKVYPQLDGIFLDQLCYDAIDYSQDDGLTMVNNQPVYKLWHCYEKPVKQLANIMHKRGKLIFANGPYNVEAQQEMDGIMAEGASWLAEIVKYLCIAKPLLFLSFYHDDPYKAEQMFQCCLLAGASYSLFPHPSKPVVKIIHTYRPLVERLYGRRWLLEPNPLDLPTGVDGNIFIGEKGDTLISLVSTRRSCLDQNGMTQNLELGVRFKKATRIKKAQCLGTHYTGLRRVRMKRSKQTLSLTVPEHSAATLIILR